MQQLLSPIRKIFRTAVGRMAFILFILMMLAALYLGLQGINLLAPAPALAVAIIAIAFLLLSLTISYLASSAPTQTTLPDQPAIIGLDYLFERWQKLQPNATESSILHKQFLLLQAVAQQQYPTAHHVEILKYFSGSKLASGTYLIQANGQAPKVLKFDRADNIQKEINRYHDSVKLHLDFVAGEPFIPAAQQLQMQGESWGTIAYKFIGNDQSEIVQLQTFAEYYQTSKRQQTLTALAQIFRIMSPWWKYPANNEHHAQAPDLYAEYDRLTRRYHQIKMGLIDANHQINDLLAHNQLSSSVEQICLTEQWHMRNPLSWIRENLMGQRLGELAYDPGLRRDSIVHGDFHAGNILMSQHHEQMTKAWVIDFPHTHVGPTVQDIARLEAEVLFGLVEATAVQQLGLEGLYTLGCALLPMTSHKQPSLACLLPDPLPTSWQETAELAKMWAVIKLMRQQASTYLNGNDARPYYLALLHATMPILYYRDRTPWQKLFAFLTSGILCERLGQ